MNIIDWFLQLGVLNSQRTKAIKCGHYTKLQGSVSAFGRTITTKMKKNDSGSADYCLDCVSKMAIQCAWCEGPIFIGDPVTLYSIGTCPILFSSTKSSEAQKKRLQKDIVIPNNAVVYFDNPLTLVGCLSENCADTGADVAGFWLPNENGQGCVRLIKTPYESIIGTGS